MFKKELTRLLPLLRLKYKDIDISFRLDEAEREAAELPAIPPAESQPTIEEITKFERLAELSPRAAIVELRSQLEDVVRRAALAKGLQMPPTKSLLFMTRLLRSRDVIDARASALLDDLRAIGNRAAHSTDESEFRKDDALRYKILVDQVTRLLEQE